MSFPNRQYDISRDTGAYATVPVDDILRHDGRNFVQFTYDSAIDPSNYVVAVESLSNASSFPQDRFRTIGPLARLVELPHVYFAQGFGSHAKILVLPKSSALPAYVGNLVRGSTYYLDRQGPVVTNEGHRALVRSGVM